MPDDYCDDYEEDAPTPRGARREREGDGFDWLEPHQAETEPHQARMWDGNLWMRVYMHIVIPPLPLQTEDFVCSQKV